MQMASPEGRPFGSHHTIKQLKVHGLPSGGAICIAAPSSPPNGYHASRPVTPLFSLFWSRISLFWSQKHWKNDGNGEKHDENSENSDRNGEKREIWRVVCG